jgi:undecaprenyl-diphosphatase
MADYLYSIDKSLFYFINHSLANPVFDVVMPFLTRSDSLYFRAFYVVVWLALVIKGGKTGRIVAVLLIPLIAASDQLSSQLIKYIVARLRPCWTLPDVRLLVPCGTGLSFPSSHAVNNFAAAGLLSHFYRKWTWAFMTYAGLIAFTRPYIGVHYPSDIVGGAIIGLLVSWLIVFLWRRFESYLADRARQKQSATSA